MKSEKRFIHWLGIGLLLLFIGISGLAPSVDAASFTFIKIADENTNIPAGTGTFNFFGGPVIDGGFVAFQGRGSGSQTGIYSYSGGALTMRADTGTMIPGASVYFTVFGFPSVSISGVSFYGESADREQRGIYSDATGSLQLIANQDTAIPGASPPVLFTGFGSRLTSENGDVAFVGLGSGSVIGVYKAVDGGLEVVSDSNTPIPAPGASGNFTEFSFPSLDQNVLAFVGKGSDGQKGIYTSGNLVADLDTPIPGAGASGNFTDIAHPAVDRLNVAFVGLGSDGQWGVYTYNPGVLSVVADTSTVIPGQSDQFINFQVASMDAGNVAFVGQNSAGEPGLYIHYDGQLHKVIATNDTLDGRTISWVSITATAVSGGDLVFSVVFADDGTEGVFMATLVGDADADRLSDAIEAVSCTGINNPDTDGDGVPDGSEDSNLSGTREMNETDPCVADTDGDAIPDGWEIYGLDWDGNTVIDVDLPAMGANALRRDLFVEVDYMDCNVPGGDCAAENTHTHQPKVEALQKVIDAFLDAPVDNPDGSTGVQLHVDAGPTSIMDPVTGAVWGILSNSEALPHDEELGGAANPLDLTKYKEIKELHFLDNRFEVFRYNLWGHSFDGRSGAGLEPGADFIVALGRYEGEVGSVNEQAGTFMHELGHNLGLAHGGDQGNSVEFNFKPNFLSVMNYRFQMRGLIFNRSFGHMDYSRFGPDDIIDLDETNLDENIGLDGPPELNDYGTGYYCEADGGYYVAYRSAPGALNGPINWNCNWDPAWPDFSPETGVMEDINYWIGVFGMDFSDQILTPYDDWANITFDGLANALVQGAPDPDIPDEITKEIDDTISTPYAVAVTGEGSVSGRAGFTKEIVFTITNVGETEDTYSLAGSSSQDWADFLTLPDTIALAPGAEQAVTVNVQVPGTAEIGDSERTKLVAQSMTNDELLDSHTTTTNVVFLSDTDGDGVPDDNDECPASDLSDQVTIDACESGVVNHLLASGCTISDRIAECADGAKNHGNFVSCVSKLTNTLKKAGTIPGNEKGRIVSCAAQAEIP